MNSKQSIEVCCLTFYSLVNACDSHGDLASTVAIVEWNRQLEETTARLRVYKAQTN